MNYYYFFKYFLYIIVKGLIVCVRNVCAMRECSCFQLFCSFNCGENWHDPVKCKVCWGSILCLKSLGPTRIAQQCYQCLYINMLSHGFVSLYIFSFYAFHCQQCLCFSKLSSVLPVISGWQTWIISINTLIYLFHWSSLIWTLQPWA